MEEREFIGQADAELARIEAALEAAQDEAGADWDFDIKPGGIIELEFADGSKIVVNRHTAAREIWLAAKAGGYRFGPPTETAAPWRDTRSGAALREILARCIGDQSGQPISLGD